MKIHTTVRLAFWIALCFGIFSGLAALTRFPQLHWFPLVLLGAAIYLFRDRPFIKAGVPASVETGVAALMALIFLAHMGWEILIPYLDAEELAARACAPRSLEARCYTYTNTDCTSIWTHFDQECRDEVKRNLDPKRATALTGPMVRKCTYKKLDQSFKGSRKATADSGCQSHFNSLIDLSQ
jgi:hypothetical protein